MNAQRTMLLGALTCLLLGALLLGNGAYLYAKAQLAQLLLQSAWQRTLTGAALVKPWP